MDFIDEKDLESVLKEFGIEREVVSEDRIELQMRSDGTVIRVHLADAASTSPPLEGADVINIDKNRLPQVVEHILHLLHLSQVLLVPFGKWRNVFDAVAFSLAENEAWQAVDAAATVELNSRDPLLCEPADFSTISELLKALFTDAEEPNQGLMLVSTASPVLIEVVPEGALRVSVGNQVLADEIADAFAVS